MRPMLDGWHDGLQIFGSQPGAFCDSSEHTRATGSCRNREEVGQFGNRFAMVETIGNDTKGKGFSPG